MIQILQECVKTWPARPELDPAEWPITAAELEAGIDHAMAQLAQVVRPSPALEQFRTAAAAMMAHGLAAMESIRGMVDTIEQCQPTKNQQLPGFRRPSWQRRA